MGISSNPWAARFEALLDADTVRARATLQVPPLVGLHCMPIELAARELGLALSTVFYPTTQCVAILQRFAGTAYAHCMTMYLDPKTFIGGVYAEECPLPGFFFPICLTGLAGCGKTELIRTFQRIQLLDTTLEVDPYHSPFPLKGSWLATVRARSDPTDVLKSLAGKYAKASDLVQECRRLAFRDGVPMVFADEFQFATGNGSANARVTQMLLSLSYIGIPFVYVANFSLLLRLQKRPGEDQQRLLSDPIILLPDSWSSDDWTMTLKAQRDVAPDVLKFDPVGDAKELHNYSAGRKRAVTTLISIAFRSEHPRKGVVDREALHRAYHSQQFAQYREESEILSSQTFGSSSNRKKRKDLWCPIPLPEGAAIKLSEAMNQARSEQVAEKELRAAMTSEERKAADDIEKSFRKPRSATGKVASMKKRAPVTGEDLKQNADWLRSIL